MDFPLMLLHALAGWILLIRLIYAHPPELWLTEPFSNTALRLLKIWVAQSFLHVLWFLILGNKLYRKMVNIEEPSTLEMNEILKSIPPELHASKRQSIFSEHFYVPLIVFGGTLPGFIVTCMASK